MSTITTKKLRISRQDDLTGQAANFYHLYWDVVWFGLVFGSTLSFLTVYATRLGASGWQIGLLTAGPAMINILVTMPAGRWLEQQALGPAVTQTAIWHRLGYFVLIPLPLLLPASLQIWAVLSLILLMAIPGTALAIGFNALLATAVPEEKRGQVVGRRNALLAGASGASFLLSGWLLNILPFEPGYGVVFALGAVAGGLSTYHLYRIRVSDPPRFQMRPLTDRAQPGRPVGFSGALPQRIHIGLRLWLNRHSRPDSGLGQISTDFKWMMGAFFLFHFSQVLPAALFPIFWVREARLTDGEIGWLNAIFYLTMLIGSLFLASFTKRFGHHHLTVAGALLLGLYPLLTALSIDIKLLLMANILGGVVWAILSGSLGNRLLEQTPPDNRPVHLALYNLALNVAILSGTMLGPFLANWTGLREALMIVFVLRVGSGLALARWG
jgi:MFS family permease